MKLFDGSDSSDDDTKDISKIEINREFARRYEHNKKREGLQRLEELKKKGLVQDSSSDSDESSEEDDLTNSKKKDLEFFNALIKVRTQDPDLKHKEIKLFESDSDDDDGGSAEEGEQREKRGKPMYLKDVAAKHLMEEGPEFGDKEEKMGGVKSYFEEQEELRKAFLDAADAALDEDDEGGELLRVKQGRNEVDWEDYDGGGEVQQKLDEYFGEDDKLDENDMFLKDYFRNRMWMEEDKGGKGFDEEGLGFSEDEEEIEKQEDYEREYNFRFEENAGDRVLGHSRFVEGSVRKNTKARKLQRKSKEERMKQVEFERKEELKHLKNLKKKEINERISRIMEIAGIGEDGLCPLDEDDLEGEFDPEEHDRKMREAFNDDYYEAEDVDPGFGSDRDDDGEEFEKPDSGEEDELLGLTKGRDDVCGSGDGFLAARERTLKRKVDNRGEEEEIVSIEGKGKKKHKMSSAEEMEQKVQQAKKEALDEYYKLDYEDTIGDLKTRFKYKPVKANRYGLSAEELLLVDEKELNQYISLKKLAPYREKEWKVPRIKAYNQKLRNKSLIEGELSNVQKVGKKNLRGDRQKSTPVAGAMENEKPQLEEPNGDAKHLSRQSRRRHGQAELKLSRFRLMAYGKIPSKPKSKKH